MARPTRNGDAGETWTNDTGQVQYQLIVAWQNSCGQCIALDHAIGDLWPIPFHPGCRCTQRSIFPDSRSLAFVDFRRKIADLSEIQRARVVGRANLALIDRGVVAWDDVVTPDRIRSLSEVVRARGLSIEDLTRAGVPRGVAARALESGPVSTRERAAAHAEATAAARNEVRQATATAEQATRPMPATSGGLGRIARRIVGAVRNFYGYLRSAGVKPDVAERLAAEP